MKKLFASLFAFAAISCNAQDKQFSKKALSTNLLTTDCKTNILFSDIIKEHQGETFVIEIWASWCGDCVKAMPSSKNLQSKNPDIDFVFISMDKTSEKWLEGIEKHEINGDHYMATDGMKGLFGQAMDVDWIPRYIIVDKNGKVVLYKAIETEFDKIQKVLDENK
jgi:thiol-disulfide isomerase/thioredoxin